jgi:hypothetical protein
MAGGKDAPVLTIIVQIIKDKRKSAGEETGFTGIQRGLLLFFSFRCPFSPGVPMNEVNRD